MGNGASIEEERAARERGGGHEPEEREEEGEGRADRAEQRVEEQREGDVADGLDQVAGETRAEQRGRGHDAAGRGGGIARHDEPGPAVGLLRVADARRGPVEHLLHELEGVLLGEAPDVGTPEQVEIRRAWPAPVVATLLICSQFLALSQREC